MVVIYRAAQSRSRGFQHMPVDTGERVEWCVVLVPVQAFNLTVGERCLNPESRVPTHCLTSQRRTLGGIARVGGRRWAGITSVGGAA